MAIATILYNQIAWLLFRYVDLMIGHANLKKNLSRSLRKTARKGGNVYRC